MSNQERSVEEIAQVIVEADSAIPTGIATYLKSEIAAAMQTERDRAEKAEARLATITGIVFGEAEMYRTISGEQHDGCSVDLDVCVLCGYADGHENRCLVSEFETFNCNLENSEERIRELKETAEQRSCARNQGSTQFCSEAMELESRLAILRRRVVEVLGPLAEHPYLFSQDDSIRLDMRTARLAATLLRELSASEKGQPEAERGHAVDFDGSGEVKWKWAPPLCGKCYKLHHHNEPCPPPPKAELEIKFTLPGPEESEAGK